MIGTQQTIQQLRAATPPSESLGHFLQQLPFTIDAQAFYALVIAGLVGMLAHYCIKWAEGEITGSLYNYLFVDNPRRTVLAFMLLGGELLVEVASGMFISDTGQLFGWGTVMFSGLKSGYLIDSLANKGRDTQEPAS